MRLQQSPSQSPSYYLNLYFQARIFDDPSASEENLTAFEIEADRAIRHLTIEDYDASGLDGLGQGDSCSSDPVDFYQRTLMCAALRAMGH